MLEKAVEGLLRLSLQRSPLIGDLVVGCPAFGLFGPHPLLVFEAA